MRFTGPVGLGIGGHGGNGLYDNGTEFWLRYSQRNPEVDNGQADLVSAMVAKFLQ